MRRCLLFLALLAGPAAADELDASLVGTWKSTLKNAGGEWTFTWKVDAGGAYRTTVSGTSPLPEEVGKISAQKGKWSVQAASGRTDAGTYAFPDKDTLTLTGRGGAMTWKRVAAIEGLDPALVGTWTATVKNDQGEWTFTFRLEASGAFRTTSAGSAALPDDIGKLSAAKGQWRSDRTNGVSDEGTYALADKDTLTLTGKTGTLTWKRGADAPRKVLDPAKTSVDPMIAGVWRMTAPDGSDWTFDLALNGEYVLSVEAARSAPVETGLIDARDGRWTLAAASLREDEGSYRLKAPGVLEFTGKGGKTTWSLVAPPTDTSRLLRMASPLSTALSDPPPQGIGFFVDGLEALEDARFTDAVALLTQAVDASSDNPVFYAVRGAARTLAADFDAAREDLARSKKLLPESHETDAWVWVLNKMSGSGGETFPIFGSAWVNFLNGVASHYGQQAGAPAKMEAWIADWKKNFDKALEKIDRNSAPFNYNSVTVGLQGDIWKIAQAHFMWRRSTVEASERAAIDAEEKAAASKMGPREQRSSNPEGKAAYQKWRADVLEFKETAVAALTAYTAKAKEGNAAKVEQSSGSALAEVGRVYARRFKSGEVRLNGLAFYLAVFDHAKKRFQNGEHARALADLNDLLAVFPEDPVLVDWHAATRQMLKDYAGAREEYSRILAANPAFADAYIGRAFVSAQLGNARRARADLETARKLDPEGAKKASAGIEKAIDALPKDLATLPLEPILERLDRDARQPYSLEGWEALASAAVELRRAMNARRLRFDETYSDRLKALYDAVAAAPKDPDRLAALARLLYEEATGLLSERVEPRGYARAYRYQSVQSRTQELTWASQLAEQAMGRNPGNVRANVVKARVLMWYGRYSDAETIIRRALAERSGAPELLTAFAELQEIAADQRAAKASDLRTVRTWSDFNYFYTRYPSPAEEEKAERLDQQASQLIGIARDAMARAALAKVRTAEGAYLQGLLDWDQGDARRAAADFSEAVKLDPKHLKAWLELSKVYAASGQSAYYHRARSGALNLVETTAAPLLQLASASISRTAFKEAGEALAEAKRLDPADARVYAWLGIAARGEKKDDEALAQFRIAAALEEAAARERGKTLAPNGAGWLHPSDLGLSLELRLRTGELLLENGRYEEAAQRFASNIMTQGRISYWDWGTMLYSAMLPDWKDDPKYEPEADCLALVMARSQLGLGLALKHLEKKDQAGSAFSAVSYYRRLVVDGPFRELFNEVEALAGGQMTGKMQYMGEGHMMPLYRNGKQAPVTEAIRLPHGATVHTFK